MNALPDSTISLPSNGAIWHRAYVVLACALILITAIYWSTVAATIASWAHDPLAHGYLVLPGAVYLALGRRKQLELLAPKPVFWALPVLALLAFVWLLGNLTDTLVVQQICLVAMVMAFVWGILGTRAASELMFPIGLLLFALPLGDRLVPILQDLTARVAVKMLALSGVPVLLQGHVISIPGSAWQVAEACSGINYLMSSLTLGYLYAGTVYRYPRHRIGFLIASVVMPLVANGFRVYTTILIASLGGTRIVAGMQHYLYGWLVFTVITAVLFATCGRWREDELRPATPRSSVFPHPRWSFALVAVLGLVVAATAPASAKVFWPPSSTESVGPIKPEVAAPWNAVARAPFSWSPRFTKPSAEFLQAYESGARNVSLYLAYYDADRVDGKLASTTNALFEEPWWPAASGYDKAVYNGRTFQARKTVLEGPRTTLVVWNWYDVDGILTSNDYLAKVLLAKARLFRSRRDSAAIAIATEYQPDRAEAATLNDFLAHVSLAEPLTPPAGE